MKLNFLILVSLIIFISGCTKQPQVKIEPKIKKETIQTSKKIIKKDVVEEGRKDEETLFEPKPIEIDKKDEIDEKDEKKYFRVAFIYPSKIMSKYAYDAINTITAYLLNSKKKFEIETFDTFDENEENIKEKVELAIESGYNKVIFFFSGFDFDYLSTINNIENLDIYFPIINHLDVKSNLTNAVYGGIDYKKQIEVLMQYSNGGIVEFMDNSPISMKLSHIFNQISNKSITKNIGTSTNYKALLNKKMNGSTFILNTPIIKSSILLSQFRANDINPSIVLSTQINYNPLIFSLTQKEDRNKLVLINSISKVDNKLEESINILDADLRYNWVNYSTYKGIDYLLKEGNIEDNSSVVSNNQMLYEYHLIKVGKYSFSPFK